MVDRPFPPARIPPRRSSRGWAPIAYYALAGVLVLLTVPMYRVIFARAASQSVDPAPQIVPVSPVSAPSPVAVAAPPVDLYRYRLASDQRCYGGAVIQIRGNVYTQIGDAARPVHCVGDYADLPVR